MNAAADSRFHPSDIRETVFDFCWLPVFLWSAACQPPSLTVKPRLRLFSDETADAKATTYQATT